MNDSLILFGYGAAMILGFAAVFTVVYYSFTRNLKYQKQVKKKIVQELEMMMVESTETVSQS